MFKTHKMLNTNELVGVNFSVNTYDSFFKKKGLYN